MDISFIKDIVRPYRPHIMIWINGEQISQIMFPSRQETINENWMQNNTPSTLEFEKKYRKNVYQPEQIVEILGLGLTQYHYFILQNNVITIMSRISQKIIHFYYLCNTQKINSIKRPMKFVRIINSPMNIILVTCMPIIFLKRDITRKRLSYILILIKTLKKYSLNLYNKKKQKKIEKKLTTDLNNI